MAWQQFEGKGTKTLDKPIKRRRRNKTLGSLNGELIPFSALKEPTHLSLKTQVFLDFCEAVAKGHLV